MKVTSIIKRIDNLGRIVLPKDIRRNLKLKENDEVEIIVKDEGYIVLKKYLAIEEYDEYCKNIVNLLEKQIESKVMITDNSSVYFCNEDIIGKNLSQKYINILEQRKIFNEKIMPIFNILEDNELLYAKAIVPIIVESTIVGSVAIYSNNKDSIIKDKDIELLKFASELISNNIKN